MAAGWSLTGHKPMRWLQALELVARSAGALGDHHLAAEAGRRAVAANPLDERSHRILIRALQRGG